MSALNDLLSNIIKKKSATKQTPFWNALEKGVTYSETANEKYINNLISRILGDDVFASSYEYVMIGINYIPVHKNNNGGSITNVLEGASQAVQTVFKTVEWIGTAMYVAETAFNQLIKNYKWEQALVEPNIEGVPISASRVTSSRQTDVGEQLVIVQGEGNKKYYTDNAVPHVKEWTIEGYLTPLLSIDPHYLIKPSLTYQIDFLDICARSRKPVLFKTHRGEFVKVQITNLQTEEEASYNNSIKVTIQLKEYNPYEIEGEYTVNSLTAGTEAINR